MSNSKLVVIYDFVSILTKRPNWKDISIICIRDHAISVENACDMNTVKKS